MLLPFIAYVDLGIDSIASSQAFTQFLSIALCLKAVGVDVHPHNGSC